MSKRKNPYDQDKNSPHKKRKLDTTTTNSSQSWCIQLTPTPNTSGNGAQFSINDEKSFKVGRDLSACAICFSEGEKMVSAIHCEFAYNPNTQKLFVKDLKSTNGVYVNNARIDNNGTLKRVRTNDIIRFGRRHVQLGWNHEYKLTLTHTTNTTNNSNNLSDIEAMLKRTVQAQLAVHSAQMQAKLAEKDEENRRIKQLLHEKEMKELSDKHRQQNQELQSKQKEFEGMRQKIEKEKLEAKNKLKIEQLSIQKEKERVIREAKDKQKLEMDRIKQKEMDAMQQEIEAQNKLKLIREKEEKLAMETAKAEEERKAHRERMEVEEAKIKEKTEKLSEKEKKVNKMASEDDKIEEETTCCMCYDILLKAHNLECGHAMCHQCIREWIDEKRPNAVCPICRAAIKNEPTPCRPLDNIIEQIYFKNKCAEAKKEYEDRLKEYKTWKTAYDNKVNSHNNNGFNWAQWGNNQNNNNNRAQPILNLASPDSSEEEESDESESEEEEESEWEESISYSCERAASGRSTCRQCWQRIEDRSLRFGVHTSADPGHGLYYDTTHWYHPRCFGTKYRHNTEARQRRNISNRAGLSARALDEKLEEIFAVNRVNNGAVNGRVNVGNNSNNNRNVRVNGRVMTVDGINFRTRMNRLQNLTVNQLKKYTAENRIHVPSSMRKAALCAMIRRDIGQHI